MCVEFCSISPLDHQNGNILMVTPTASVGVTRFQIFEFLHFREKIVFMPLPAGRGGRMNCEAIQDDGVGSEESNLQIKISWNTSSAARLFPGSVSACWF
jgi:hypothetical protein